MKSDAVSLRAGGMGEFVGDTYRTVDPVETFRRVQPFLRQVGITRVANVTGMDTVGIPTVMVIRPNARSLSVSQGKGIDLISAKVSGVMESIEQWHAERIERPLRLAPLSDLAGRVTVVDVDRLPQVAERYQPSDRVLWIEGTEVDSGESVWVPYETVYLDLTLPLPEGSGHFLVGSNGLASGNHVLEALAHGICELIERDATTLFYLLPWQEQWRRRLDLDSVTDAACRKMLRAFSGAEVDVAVWETTSDIGVPSYLCSILDRVRDPFRPVGLARGAGCHSRPGVALARALTEAAQSRLTKIVGTRDDIQRHDFEALQSESKQAEHRAQMAAPGTPPVRFDDGSLLRTTIGSTLTTDVSWLCERVRAAGLGPVVAVNLSRPDLPISVVRAIIPGLEALSELPAYQPGERARRQMAELSA